MDVEVRKLVATVFAITRAQVVDLAVRGAEMLVSGKTVRLQRTLEDRAKIEKLANLAKRASMILGTILLASTEGLVLVMTPAKRKWFVSRPVAAWRILRMILMGGLWLTVMTP